MPTATAKKTVKKAAAPKAASKKTKSASTKPAAKQTKPAAVKKTNVGASKKATDQVAAKKAAGNADELKWRSIHVFGLGDTMIMGDGVNGRIANAELTSLKPLMASLAKKQQKGTNVNLDELHVLNIFNGDRIGFLSRSPKNMNQRFAWNDVDVKHVNKLADEVMAKMPKPAKGNTRQTGMEERQKQRLARRKAAQARMKELMKAATTAPAKPTKKTAKK